ncbi:MAG TPA: response regulator [Aggregatilineales bacterium]|nr:response regulator [Aggregatilineales bacterium]
MLLSNKRIFLIEDNLRNLNMMQLMLEKYEARISYERWGQDTVLHLQLFIPVDLILLDLNFPDGVSGFDIYDAIRAQPDFQTVPIAAVSATDASVALPKAKAKGFAGYISKPLDFVLFPQQVAALIEGKHIWQEI